MCNNYVVAGKTEQTLSLVVVAVVVVTLSLVVVAVVVVTRWRDRWHSG